MPDFWRHSGFHLADRDAEGKLIAAAIRLRGSTIGERSADPAGEAACAVMPAGYSS